MEQGSAEWLNWRRSGLGSSDAPVVLGLSPWTTAYQLWLTKCGIEQPNANTNTFVTDRGTRLEPRARAMYEIENGFIDMLPTLVVHEKYPWLRASLDGFNQGLNRVLELKAPGAETHAAAKAGKLPPYYYAQVQQQLLVTGAERADYVSLSMTDEGKPNERSEIATVQVFPDVPYCRELLARLQAFWELVQRRVPPELVARDYKSVRVKGFKAKCQAYAEAHRALERMRLELVGDEAVKSLERWRCGDLRVGRLTNPAQTEYDTLLQSHGVNPIYVNVEASNDEP